MLRRWLTLASVVMTGLVAMPAPRAYAQDACLVSASPYEIVTSRYGKIRDGNIGSANSKPHAHDGLDFSTGAKSVTLTAAGDGKVAYVGGWGGGGNTIIVRRPSGDSYQYEHLQSFVNPTTQKPWRVGDAVTAGQPFAISGNTNTGDGGTINGMIKHLHFTYGTAQKNEQRSKAFHVSAQSGPFNPSQLSSVFDAAQGVVGFRTDPSPYFCKTYPIQDGDAASASILGADTKAQYAKLFGSVPSGGVPPNVQWDATTVEAANADAALAAAAGKTTVENLSDRDTYGAQPDGVMGGYDAQSVNQMLLTEVSRRFTGWQWEQDISQAPLRALQVEYSRALGVGSFLSEAIYRKKERLEGLLATYVSLKAARAKEVSRKAQERASTDSMQWNIH